VSLARATEPDIGTTVKERSVVTHVRLEGTFDGPSCRPPRKHSLTVTMQARAVCSRETFAAGRRAVVRVSAKLAPAR